jgi:DNA-binding CsgD family transcriptional regulator
MGEPPLPARSTLLVGRHAEFGRLQVALDQARGGEGRLVLVSGEPGIGKTRLVEELAVQAASVGVLAAWGRVDEPGDAPPYWPWTQLLASVLDECERDVVCDALVETADVIAPILPEVKEFVSAIVPPPALDPGEARFRFHQAIAAFLNAVSRRQRLMVVLEDSHWADRASLELTRFVAARLSSMPVLLVMTYRNVDAGVSEAFEDVLASLARQPRLERIPLRGLTESEVGRFIAQTVAVVPAAATVSAVHARTEGNPFFVEELARLLESEGAFRPGGKDDEAQGVVPIGVRDVVRRRVLRLPPETRDLLTMAAVIGRDFDLAVLASAADLAEVDSLERIGPAIDAGLVTEATDSVARFRFSHALIRDAVYRELSGLQRATLHARVGGALEGQVAPGSHSAELAWHFFRAAPISGPERGVAYAIAAARADEAVLAFDQAEAGLGRALELIARLPVGADRLERELYVSNRLVAISIMTKGHTSPEVARAVDRANELRHEIGESQELFKAMNNQTAFHCLRGELTMGTNSAAQMLDIGEQLSNPTWLAAGQFFTAMAHLYAGRVIAARDRFAFARDAAVVFDLSPAVAEFFSGYHPIPMGLVYSAVAAWMAGEEPQARSFAQAALDTATTLDQPHTLAYALYVVTQLKVLADDAEGALASSQRAIDWCDQRGLTSYHGWFQMLRGWAISERGHPEDGVDEMAAAITLNRSTGSRLDTPFFLGLLADGERRRGNLGGALAAVDDALAEAGEIKLWESDLYRRRAQVLAALSRRGQAAESLAMAISVADAQASAPFRQRAVAAAALLEAAETPPSSSSRLGAGAELSAREAEVVGLVARGLTDREIAAEMLISLATVRSHLERIRDKTGRRRRSELTRLAVELGLASD